MRVSVYKCTTVDKNGNTVMVKILPFTPIHAKECGTTLELGGIDIGLARKLCEKWTRLGIHSDKRFIFTVDAQ